MLAIFFYLPNAHAPASEAAIQLLFRLARACEDEGCEDYCVCGCVCALVSW